LRTPRHGSRRRPHAIYPHLRESRATEMAAIRTDRRTAKSQASPPLARGAASDPGLAPRRSGLAQAPNAHYPSDGKAARWRHPPGQTVGHQAIARGPEQQPSPVDSSPPTRWKRPPCPALGARRIARARGARYGGPGYPGELSRVLVSHHPRHTRTGQRQSDAASDASPPSSPEQALERSSCGSGTEHGGARVSSRDSEPRPGRPHRCKPTSPRRRHEDVTVGEVLRRPARGGDRDPPVPGSPGSPGSPPARAWSRARAPAT